MTTLDTPPNAAPMFTASGLRMWSGFLLFSFALTHFLNHALGLWSLEAMQAMQDWRLAVTRSLPGAAILIAAGLTHFSLGVARFLRARTWRLGVRNGVQLAFGLLIPILMIRHVLGTRGVNLLYGIETDYGYALWAMWPGEAWRQAFLIGLVWVHGCIGLHHLGMLKPWYQRSAALWYGMAVAIPLLAFAGFDAAGREARLLSSFENPFTAEEYAQISGLFTFGVLGYSVLLAAAVVIWGGLLLRDRMGARVRVEYSHGARAVAPKGQTLLEISRSNRIPHASVCGGRARCSTCRVRVTAGLDAQPPASEAERRVLARVGAPSNVRLACQLRPEGALSVSMLMPAQVDAAALTDPYHWGVEREVTLMFCDLRGFTKMAEGRLSFDVVFLLNQFLGRMAEAIEDSGGYVDKFMGDGIMAIFGMEAPADQGARQSIAAVRAMGGVMEALNQSLREELAGGLHAGIGLHSGLVILGRIGAASRTDAAARITALGDAVNLASRLEGMTKDLGVSVIVSDATMRLAGLPPGALTQAEIEVRGLSAPVPVWTARRTADLPEA